MRMFLLITVVTDLNFLNSNPVSVVGIPVVVLSL